jgi:hypothetical protein
MRKSRIIIATFFSGFFLISGITSVLAKSFLETQLTSGTIKNIKEKVIDIDDNEVFYPAPIIGKHDLNSGDSVTLRYYVDNSGRKVYVEIRKGLNSLSERSNPVNTQTTLK